MENLKTLIRYLADILVDPEVTPTAGKIIELVKSEKGYQKCSDLQAMTLEKIVEETFTECATNTLKAMRDALDTKISRAEAIAMGLDDEFLDE